MIPRIIHYCWFGKNPKPPLVLFCIASWEKMCPDYKIMEWNEDNFDVFANPYTAEAYIAKKWAFVTDYVRLWVLYRHGGIYMDTDVQIIGSLDPFLQNVSFSGFETSGAVPTGIFGSEAHSPLIYDLLSEYSGKHFVLENGSYNLETNVVSITRHLLKCGLQQNNTKQTVHGLTLYPTRFFCPKSYRTRKFEISRDTAAIHHFSGSWLDKDRNALKIDSVFLNFFRSSPPLRAMKKCNRFVTRKQARAFLKRLSPRRIINSIKRRLKRRAK